MRLIDERAPALAILVAAAGLVALPASAAESLYVLGPEASVASALQGERVRACAPAVVTLPETFEHLRTPPGETTKAVALRICEVMVVGGDEVPTATRDLAELDISARAAPLNGRVAGTPNPNLDAGLQLASAGPADQLAATSSSAEAETLFYQAYEALQQNRVEEAIGLFERGLRIAPTNHLALFYLGNAYEAAGQPGRARTLYERVSAVAPRSAEAVQASERLAALRASSATPRPSGRFASGIYIDPASPPEGGSIRDVFERSPMANDETRVETRRQELPPPPVPPLRSSAPPRIEAPAVPPAQESTPRRDREPVAEAPVQAAVAGSEAAPSQAASPLRPRLDRMADSGEVGTGRLQTRLGSARVPPPESVEVARDEPAPTPRSGGDDQTGVALPTPTDSATVQEAALATPETGIGASTSSRSGRIEIGRGAVYQGSLSGGIPHGKGTITYADGSTYDGAFENGERTGAGVFVSAEGWRYEGEFRNGKFEGRGTLNFADGGTYTGEFRGGARTGTGVYTWPSGARYEGSFRDGAIVGSGIYIAPDGVRYEGDFAEGRRAGEGTLTFPDGRIYVGHIANGVPQGEGSFYWPDGRRFSGVFNSGAADGIGTMVHSDGRTESGFWRSRPLMVDLMRVQQ